MSDDMYFSAMILVGILIGLLCFIIAFEDYIVAWRKPNPVVGENYVLNSLLDNPFNKRVVKVLEISHGYVKFQEGFTESTCTVHSFKVHYSKPKFDIQEVL